MSKKTTRNCPDCGAEPSRHENPNWKGESWACGNSATTDGLVSTSYTCQKNVIKNLRLQLTLQPCGHPASSIVSSGEGTHHCGMCAEIEKARGDAATDLKEFGDMYAQSLIARLQAMADDGECALARAAAPDFILELASQMARRLSASPPAGKDTPPPAQEQER